MKSLKTITYHLSKEAFRLVIEDVADRFDLFDRIILWGVKNQGLVKKIPLPTDLDVAVPIHIRDDQNPNNYCPNQSVCTTLSRMVLAYYDAKLSPTFR